MRHYDFLVIGGGAAGLAAAICAGNAGKTVLLVERESEPGGVLLQCVHHGFGMGRFGEDMTGREYAARYSKMLLECPVDTCYNTTVIRLSLEKWALLSSPEGLISVSFSMCILATGCREQSLYSLPMGGTRPAGVFTAGQVQHMMNLEGRIPGRNYVILGSGDIGQIMARQLIQAGCTVSAMVEQNDEPGGMARNRRDCLEAYHIPLVCRSTITALHGYPRLTGVTVRNLQTGAERIITCDTVMTSLGLIPDRKLAEPLLEDGVLPGWLYLCGNCESVHSIVDSVSLQAEQLIHLYLS